MKFTKKDFDWAASQGLLTSEQVTALWEALSKRDRLTARFDLAHIGYYTGALIVILAMGWFLAISWEPYGHCGILMISGFYALAFTLLGKHFWKQPDLKIPGGLLITMSVSMTPLIVYALERLSGFWPQGDPGNYVGYHTYVKGSWFLMELSTIVASLVALRFVRFPFLLAPLSFSLWYMSMDMTPLLFGKTEFQWDERLTVSLVFGLGMLLTGYWIDLKKQSTEDYAFWLYFFGMLAFWLGLTLTHKGGEWGEFAYFAVNLLLLLLSVLLQRKLFIVFGGIGVVGYLSHLAYEVFKDWMMFPIALSAIGLGIIYLAVRYQKNQEKIEQIVMSWIPETLKPFLPARR